MAFAPDPLRLYTQYDPASIPDWRLAAKNIRCLPGNVVVECLSAPERIGSLFIPDRARATYYDDETPMAGFEPSVCVVLSACPSIPLKPGDLVLVYDGDGLCKENAVFGEYRASGEVRIYGKVSPEQGFIEDLPWEESILAALDNEMIKPTGKNVLLRRDSAIKEKSGILLPDVVEEYSGMATVEAVGEEVQDLKARDRVAYLVGGLMDFYDPKHKELCMVREKAILCVVQVAA